MPPPRFAAVRPVAAATTAGLLTALALRLSTDVFAAGPLACAGALGIAAAGLALPAPRPPIRLVLAGLGAVLALGAHPATRFFAWLGGYAALPWFCAAYGGALFFALAAPFRARVVRAGRVGLLLGAAALLLGAFLPTWALVAAVLAGAAPSARGTGEDPLPVPFGAHLRRGALALPVVLAGLVGWSSIRAVLDPTPLGFGALVAGGLVGAALSFGAWAAVPGVALLGGLGWVLAERLPDVIARGPYVGLVLLSAAGIGLGLVLGPLLGRGGEAPPQRPPERSWSPLPAFAVAMLAAASLLPTALSLLPPAIAGWAARAESTGWAGRARMAGVRERASLAWANVGPTGATALHHLDDHVLAELDGTLADPDTRAGAAERFAGTLGACATDGRTRARVGGDDFGLAADALRAQGFRGIDTAVPDAGFARAQADARPALKRTWLDPAVRLVALPAPAVLRAGPAADVVVEIVRAPWADGRRTVPVAADLAATRATLVDGGAHVLAVAATGLPEGALEATIADFLVIYPGASLWLPPEGADTALLLGRTTATPIPWAGIERCVTADRATLAARSLRTALDVGALALADAGALARLVEGVPGAAWRARAPALPDTLHAAPRLSVTALGPLTADPAVLFTGAPADLAARAEGRDLLLALLRDASSGDVEEALTRARALARTPDGARALAPVLAPHLDRARQAIARGAQEGIASKAWAEAETALATVRALAPDLAATRCLEGEIAGAQAQLPRAEEAYAACAEADPASLDALEGLARVRLSRGNRPGAEDALRAALRARPDAWTTSQRLGVFLLQQGRYDEAERLLKQASAIQSRDGADLVAAPYLALGRLYLDTDRAELALAQAERAVALGGGADALALRGAARYDLRQLDIAEDDFRAALERAPTNVLARGGMGQIQASRGEYELAAASFRAVLEVEPQHPGARESLGRLGRLLDEGP